MVLGGPDMHVDQGSTINLTCVSKFNPTPPGDVTWYLNGKVSTFVMDKEFSYGIMTICIKELGDSAVD